MASAITKPQLRKAGDLTITGLDAILDNLNSILTKTRAENLKGIFMEAGVVLRDRAKANVPVRTGSLKKRIFAAPGKSDKPDILVGVAKPDKGYPYEMAVEYGTSRMSAHPFFRPAITESRDEVGKIIITGVWHVIEDAVTPSLALAA